MQPCDAGEGEAEQVPGVHAENHREFLRGDVLPEFRVADHERIADKNGSGEQDHSPITATRNAREKDDESQIRRQRKAEQKV